MTEILATAVTIIKPIIEIIILWIAFYHILVFFAGTRSFQVLRGITYIAIIFFASLLLKLTTINWILTKLFGISIIGFLIIFQQEIRQGLARLGRQHLFNISLEEAELSALIEELTTAAYRMSKSKTGCLIAIEREARLQTSIDSGLVLDAKVSAELIESIFMHGSPLHDGGVIIRRDSIIAATCLFPLSENPNFHQIIGTRHRAALGLTEQTDAIVIMVSEETGEISVAEEGRFIPVINRERLVNILKHIVVTQRTKS